MEGTRRTRRSLSGDEWRGVLQRFADQGESVGAFCRREGLSSSSFRLWRDRLTGKADDRSARASTPPVGDVGTTDFVDLGALGVASKSPGARLELKLELGGGVTLHIVRG